MIYVIIIIMNIFIDILFIVKSDEKILFIITTKFLVIIFILLLHPIC